MRLRWSDGARQDLDDIAAYIARDDRRAARRWIEKLRRRTQLAATAPYGGRVVPEIGREETREVFERTYRIIYTIEAGAIIVLAVREGHQRLRM